MNYKRYAQYHETDKMGVVHHSNYIKWFEEARVFWLEGLDLNYAGLESKGIYSPVTEVSVKYLRPVRFDDTVEIEVSVKVYTGVRLEVAYEIRGTDGGELRCVGGSKHCFVDKTGKVLNLKRSHPEVDRVLRAQLPAGE